MRGPATWCHRRSPHPRPALAVDPALPTQNPRDWVQGGGVALYCCLCGVFFSSPFLFFCSFLPIHPFSPELLLPLSASSEHPQPRLPSMSLFRCCYTGTASVKDAAICLHHYRFPPGLCGNTDLKYNFPGLIFASPSSRNQRSCY